MTDTTQSPHATLANAPNIAILSSATSSVHKEPPAAIVTIHPGGGFPEFSVPAAARSLSGFREWALSESFPERGQITYSPQELIIDMSPELFETYNFIKMDVGAALNTLVENRKLGRFFADRALFSNELASISTEPDGMFVSGKSLRSERCKLVESKRPGANIEIVGSPDLVLEIVSPTSIKKDKEILREGYFRAGVGEYWIINALGDELEFQILVPETDGFVDVTEQQDGLASPTFGCSFRLTGAKDDDGFMHYTLHIRD